MGPLLCFGVGNEAIWAAGVTLMGGIKSPGRSGRMIYWLPAVAILFILALPFLTCLGSVAHVAHCKNNRRPL